MQPRYGSDYIVDILRALDIEYAAFNPGASFRGLHDSLVNYGDSRRPEVILCCHEEVSVAIAHGYGRAAGRPMAAILHNVVGLMHATIAIFNAWCDRAPVLLLGGTGPMDVTRRRPWIDWIHTALVQGNLIRDFVKWDDQPATLASVPDSLLRAWRLATTEPTAPVYVCLDADLQEMEVSPADLPPLPDASRYRPPTPPQADAAALDRLAGWLLEAQAPVIVADRAGRRPEAVAALVELAELLGAPVIDLWNRFNFPNTHPLDLTGAEGQLFPEADVVLALDVTDLFGTLSVTDRTARTVRSVLRPGAKVAHITLADFLVRSLVADYQRLPEVDLPIAAETALAVPALVQVLRQRLAADPQLAGAFARRKEARLSRLAALRQEVRAQWEEAARRGESQQPVAVATLAREVYHAVRGYDWVLANGDLHGWARRLWRFDKPYQWQGGQDGRRRGLRRGHLPGGGAGQPGERPADRGPAARRGPAVHPQRPLDRRPPPDPAADRDVQQPLLLQLRRARPQHGPLAPAAGGAGGHRYPDPGSGGGLRRLGPVLRPLGRGAHHRPGPGAGGGGPGSPGGGGTGEGGAGGRALPAPVTGPVQAAAVRRAAPRGEPAAARPGYPIAGEVTAMAEHFVAKAGDLPDGGRKIIQVDGVEIGVFRRGSAYYAYENLCPHQGGPVCLGVVVGKVVPIYGEGRTYLGDTYSDDVLHLVCPWHGVEFDLATGQCASERRWRLRQYPVVQRGDEIYVVV